MNAAGWTISLIAIAIALVLALRWERATRTGSGAPPRAGTTEFMSPPWVDMARREITAALEGADLGTAPYTLSEEFTDPPAHLGRGGSTIGFSVSVGGGRVQVDGVPRHDADLRIISDYHDALVVARDPDAASTDPAEAERRIAEGRLRIEGDPSTAPPALAQLDIHRLLAAHTA